MFVRLHFKPNQLIEKYGQMAGGSYTVVINHEKCWTAVKNMSLCFNLYALIRRITHSFKSMKFYMYFFLWSITFMKFYVFWYFIFLLVPWVKNVTKWICRTFETFGFLYWKHASLISIWNLQERVIFYFLCRQYNTFD